MNVILSSLILIINATLFAAIGSVYLKIGSDKIVTRGNIITLIRKNYHLLLGLAGYSLGAVFNILAYKNSELAIIYPLTSLAYIWSLLMARKILKEKITVLKTIGISLIIIGVFLTLM